MTLRVSTLAILAVNIAALMAVWPAHRANGASAQPPSSVVQIDDDDIGGVVTSTRGPEAGVWVIAQTTELGTRFAKMVVTDDRGHYVVPDLPQASYNVWVRGYGLVDSPKVKTERGKVVNLTAVIAPNAAAAAQYYPGIYWFSMLEIPDKSLFPGTGPTGNGMPVTFKTQEQWLAMVQLNGCGNCHQWGNKATREIPAALGTFDSSHAAWMRRLQSGQGGTAMLRAIGQMNTADGGHLARLARWTDRIKAGELPASVPARPNGVERNVVVTVYDWSNPKAYMHDLALTDKRKPTVNPYGLIYGAPELSTSDIPVLDPVKIVKSVLRVPVRDQDVPSSKEAFPVVAASPYFGMEAIWDTQVNAHTPTMDQEGRVYFTAQLRSPMNVPAYCSRDSGHPSAQAFPLDIKRPGFVQNSRQVTVYDPKTRKFSFIDTCFGTHHLNFAEDANDMLWLSNNTDSAAVVGWVNTKMFWETSDAAKSQGWTALVVDTNGNGKRDDYVEPDQPVDPTKDKRIALAFYGVAWNPVDGSVWGSNLTHPGYIIRLMPGPNPPQTALAEVYKVPEPGFGLRGLDLDRKGVIWVGLASGHMASFDRSRCQGPLNGPEAAQGNLCPEGWTFYPLPGPGFKGTAGVAEGPYYTWVDQHDTFGLGTDTPITTGNFSDSLYALTYRKGHPTACPLSHGLLRQGPGWAHRRPPSRLEGQGTVGDLRHPNAGTHRRHRRAVCGRARQDSVQPAGRPFQDPTGGRPNASDRRSARRGDPRLGETGIRQPRIPACLPV